MSYFSVVFCVFLSFLLGLIGHAAGLNVIACGVAGAEIGLGMWLVANLGNRE